GTGNIVEAVPHLRDITDGIRRPQALPVEELMTAARALAAPYDLVLHVHKPGRVPAPLRCAGGVATPADAALVRQLGAEGVFVGSGIFRSESPERRARAIVEATAHYRDPQVLVEVSRGLGEAMRGLDLREIPEEQLLAGRGV